MESNTGNVCLDYLFLVEARDCPRFLGEAWPHITDALYAGEEPFGEQVGRVLSSVRIRSNPCYGERTEQETK